MSEIRIGPNRISVPRMKAEFVVEITKVKGREVTLEVGGREYTLREGDTFNFSLDVS